MQRSGMGSILFFSVLFIHTCLVCNAQFRNGLEWSKDGSSYFTAGLKGIVLTSVIDHKEIVIVPNDKLIPSGHTNPLYIREFYFSGDGQKILIYTNTKKVWRYDTRGDYWVYNLQNNSLSQLGKSLPAFSLMFAKFSPDGNKAAYVSGHNLFVEDIYPSQIKQLTFDGTRKLINGIFDWVYEEE